jgi:hypothetical protein
MALTNCSFRAFPTTLRAVPVRPGHHADLREGEAPAEPQF